MKYFYLVAGALLMGLGLAGAGGEWPRMGMAMIFLGLGSGYQALKTWRAEDPRRQLSSLENFEEERAALLAQSYDKALADYQAIESARKSLKDPALSQQIVRLQQIANNLLRYLEKNPAKLPLAQRFIDYYQDRAVMLLEKYQEFEATSLSTEEMQAMQERLKSALSGLDEAYEEQFQRLLSDQFLDLDAELKVMEQTLDAEGIQRKADDPALLAKGEQEQESMPPLPETSKAYPFGQRLAATRPLVATPRIAAMRRRQRQLSIIPQEEIDDVKRTRNIQSFLAIFLGGLGIHKFYQRKFFQGVIYFLFSWTFIPGIVGFCEGMRYLFMRLDDFYEEYYLPRL